MSKVYHVKIEARRSSIYQLTTRLRAVSPAEAKRFAVQAVAENLGDLLDGTDPFKQTDRCDDMTAVVVEQSFDSDVDQDLLDLDDDGEERPELCPGRMENPLQEELFSEEQL